MGTNYYTKLNNCEKCGRYDEIHLGKSSAGWQFSFQYNGGKYYKDIEEMREFLKDKGILDEYGNSINSKEFFSMVERKQKEKFNHAEKHPLDRDFIINGYSFTDCEFS